MAGKAGSETMNRRRSIPIEVGSTNVFADLGYANAAEMRRKSQPKSLTQSRRESSRRMPLPNCWASIS
jgi:hypothetical protein